MYHQNVKLYDVTNYIISSKTGENLINIKINKYHS